MVNVQWQDDPQTLYFNELELNDAFRIVGCEAVYIKVHDGNTKTVGILDTPRVKRRGEPIPPYYDNVFMYEIASGLLFHPTNSSVEMVEVTIKVKSKKYKPRRNR